jgi:hypothetical protein
VPYNGSGSFSIPNSFTPATTILSSRVNANFSDIAAGLSNVLTRDNQAPMTAPLRLADGSQPLPGLQFANDTNTGFRRSATDVMRWVAGGADAMFIDAALKAWFLGALDAAGAATFNGGLVSRGTTSGDGDDEVSAEQYSADTTGPGLEFRKSRNATPGSHTIIQSGDTLGVINFTGSDGTDFEDGAGIVAIC